MASTADRLAAEADPDLIVAWCEYADTQSGMPPGALVQAIRRGAQPVPARRRRKQADVQREYGESIVDWLRANFPEWNRDEGSRTHSAAIACVIRLHHEHGKGSLTKAEHGPEIRAAVSRFEREFATETAA